jgi:hypothetical protein
MNLIPIIAKELGVEIGEEFRIKDESGVDEDFHRFTDCRLEYYDQAMCSWQESAMIIKLIDGSAEVVKKPFEPKNGERYWTVYWKEIGDMPCAVYEIWRDDSCDFANKVSGNCFRTKTEAEMHKYEIYEKLTGRKWEEHESAD